MPKATRWWQCTQYRAPGFAALFGRRRDIRGPALLGRHMSSNFKLCKENASEFMNRFQSALNISKLNYHSMEWLIHLLIVPGAPGRLWDVCLPLAAGFLHREEILTFYRWHFLSSRSMLQCAAMPAVQPQSKKVGRSQINSWEKKTEGNFEFSPMPCRPYFHYIPHSSWLTVRVSLMRTNEFLDGWYTAVNLLK